jgi:hypothetical protein
MQKLTSPKEMFRNWFLVYGFQYIATLPGGMLRLESRKVEFVSAHLQPWWNQEATRRVGTAEMPGN